MKKGKWLTISFLLVLMGSGILWWKWYFDPIRDPKFAMGLKKGDLFILKEDVWLQCEYAGEKPVALIPWSHYEVSKTEFLANPEEAGKIEPYGFAYLGKIIEKGSKIKFLKIVREHSMLMSSTVYYGEVISDSDLKGESLVINAILLEFGERTDEYLQLVDE